MKINKFMRKNKTLIFVALVYMVLFILNPEKATKAISNSTYYLVEMIMIMPVVYLVTVVLGVLIPKVAIIKGFVFDS